MQTIRNFFGMLMTLIYEGIDQLGPEPQYISYFAITILIITVIFKLLTLPVTLSSIKTQRINAKMQPEMKKLQEKHKNEPQLLQQKMMELQREHGFNPLAGCLPMILQMVLVIAIFGVMREPDLYLFGGQGTLEIHKHFFWIKDLSLPDPYWYGLPLINGISQFAFISIMAPPGGDSGDNPAAGMSNSMKFFMPIMIFWFARQYTAGLALYWAFSNIVELIIRSILRLRDQKQAQASEG